MNGSGYATNLDSDEVAAMLVANMSNAEVMDWVKNLIEWEMPLSAFIAEHEDPGHLMQMFADAFPDSVRTDPEYGRED